MANKASARGDCYEYVRSYYGVNAYVGVRVKLRDGTQGVLVRATHSQHYVHIRLDGKNYSSVYHPTDGVEYLVAQPAVKGATHDGH